MQIVNEVEHEDGSATYTFDLTEEERTIMIKQGILWSLVVGISGVTPQGVLKQWLKDNE